MTDSVVLMDARAINGRPSADLLPKEGIFGLFLLLQVSHIIQTFASSYIKCCFLMQTRHSSVG